MPFKPATRHQHLDIVTYLLQQGAAPNLNTGDPGYHHHYTLGDAVMQSPTEPAEYERVLEIIRQLLHTDRTKPYDRAYAEGVALIPTPPPHAMPSTPPQPHRW